MVYEIQEHPSELREWWVFDKCSPFEVPYVSLPASVDKIIAIASGIPSQYLKKPCR